MERFCIGERVHLPAFGFGTVSKDERDSIVEIVFDGREPRLIALKFHALARVTAEQESQMQAADLRSCRETFVFDSAADDRDESAPVPAHSWVRRLLPFRDVESVAALAQETWRNGRYAYAMSDFDVNRPPPWPPGFHLPEGETRRWPELQDSVHFACAKNPVGKLDACAPFPVIDHGTQATLRIDTVQVLESGVEAQIDASWESAKLTLRDTAFTANSRWYRSGRKAEFVLSALAYTCDYADEPDFELADDHPMIQAAREAARYQGHDPEAVSSRFTLKGLAVLLPASHPDTDRGDHEFRGTITEVVAYNMLDQPGWLLSVCVLRTTFGADAELVLRILVTDRVWKGDEPPQVGKDVFGVLWLQGRLWSPPEILA